MLCPFKACGLVLCLIPSPLAWAEVGRPLKSKQLRDHIHAKSDHQKAEGEDHVLPLLTSYPSLVTALTFWLRLRQAVREPRPERRARLLRPARLQAPWEVPQDEVQLR